MVRTGPLPWRSVDVAGSTRLGAIQEVEAVGVHPGVSRSMQMDQFSCAALQGEDARYAGIEVEVQKARGVFMHGHMCVWRCRAATLQLGRTEAIATAIQKQARGAAEGQWRFGASPSDYDERSSKGAIGEGAPGATKEEAVETSGEEASAASAEEVILRLSCSRRTTVGSM